MIECLDRSRAEYHVRVPEALPCLDHRHLRFWRLGNILVMIVIALTSEPVNDFIDERFLHSTPTRRFTRKLRRRILIGVKSKMHF